MGNILEGLNEQQKKAVIHTEGSMLVLAGAGSGKTKVLTTRISNLVQNGVNPYSIMAVTFTNKAAKEMQARLGAILGEDVVKKNVGWYVPQYLWKNPASGFSQL